MADDSRTVTFFLKDSYGAPSAPLNTLPAVEFETSTQALIHDLAKEAFAQAGLAPFEHYNILFVSLPDEDGQRSLAAYLQVGVRGDGLL